MDLLKKNYDVTDLSNYHTPARAAYFFTLSSLSDVDTLYEIHSWAHKNGLPVLYVSGGTNLLFGFETYRGVIVYNTLMGWDYDTASKMLTSFGAEKIWDIAKTLETDYGQPIWHRFIGLPGSIAGAVYGNAGCFGLETSNNFLSCDVVDVTSGEKKKFIKNQMDFDYRNSKLKREKKYFLISAQFDLSEIHEKYPSDVDNIFFRETIQPRGYSCGSFFKNPSREHSAGSLIEQVGLKGFHVGGAYFSEKHANFLMSDGTATSSELLELVFLARERVQEKFDIYLENEVQIITNS